MKIEAARLLFLDTRNDTLDEFIEEIGYHLGAIFYYEKVAQSFDEDETEIAAFLNRLMKTPKLSVIPSERRLGARLVTGNWVVKRLFFYLNPMDRPINKAFAQILAYERYVESPAQATDTTAHPVTEQRPVPATSIIRESSHKVTPTYAPHRSEDQATASAVSTQESAASDSGAKTTAEVDSVKKAYQALDKPHQQPKEGTHMSQWRQLSGVAPIVEWVNQKGVPYTALLKAPLTPLSFIKQFAAAWPGANLVIAVPELTRSLMVTLAPLIRQVLATQGNVKLYAGQLKRVLTPEDHGKAVSATALLALMNLGVAFGSLDALPVGGFLELRGQKQVVDVLAASGLDAVDQTPAERLTPYQGTVAPVGMSPFAGWTAQLTDEQAPITRQALESLLFSDELSELGF